MYGLKKLNRAIIKLIAMKAAAMMPRRSLTKSLPPKRFMKPIMILLVGTSLPMILSIVVPRSIGISICSALDMISNKNANR